MDGCNTNASEIEAGDHVRLLSDDWSLVGCDIVVVEGGGAGGGAPHAGEGGGGASGAPVPGATQCVIRAGGEQRTVSRVGLRRV